MAGFLVKANDVQFKNYSAMLSLLQLVKQAPEVRCFNQILGCCKIPSVSCITVHCVAAVAAVLLTARKASVSTVAVAATAAILGPLHPATVQAATVLVIDAGAATVSNRLAVAKLGVYTLSPAIGKKRGADI